MLDRAIALLALIVLGAFLGILVWKVPRIDLMAVIAITLGLAIWDFVLSARQGARGR